MTGYTREFIVSQIDYYKKHLGSGNFHDRNMIVSLYHYWYRELNQYDSRKTDETTHCCSIR